MLSFSQDAIMLNGWNMGQQHMGRLQSEKVPVRRVWITSWFCFSLHLFNSKFTIILMVFFVVVEQTANKSAQTELNFFPPPPYGTIRQNNWFLIPINIDYINGLFAGIEHLGNKEREWAPFSEQQQKKSFLPLTKINARSPATTSVIN